MGALLQDMSWLEAMRAILAELLKLVKLEVVDEEHDSYPGARRVFGRLLSVPGVTVLLTTGTGWSVPRGMFRAYIGNELPPEYHRFDIATTGGNFTLKQTPEKAAKAIYARLLRDGQAEAYIGALRSKHDRKEALREAGRRALEAFNTLARCEYVALAGDFPGVDPFVSRDCNGDEAIRVADSLEYFTVEMYGNNYFPYRDCKLWGGPENEPVRVSLGGNFGSLSFATAAKIAALVAVDKEASR